MEDLMYAGLTVAFFAVSWLMVELFDRLSRGAS